ncbi:histidinol-phosphate transaminase [Mucilaginibacter myungsuensis]
MAGGLVAASGTVNTLTAAPLNKAPSAAPEFLSEQDFLRQLPPTEMKARLSANENPFGPSPAAKKALQDAIDGSFRYPMGSMRTLATKIAESEGLQASNILLSSGSSPLLQAAAMHFTKGGKSVISGDLSYNDLPGQAARYGGSWIKVPMTPDLKLDLDAMEAKVDSNTGLVYICNPNNPTATMVDTAKLKAFCERVSKKTTVMVDEAYIDYLPNMADVTLMGGVKAGQNIIVARTFSKLYGFAGLRCGYFVGQPELMREISAYTSTGMALSATTIAAAIAAYHETPFLQDALKKTMASKEFLYATLKKEGYEYIPSSANFVLFPIKMAPQQFSQEMNKRGVSIRTWTYGGKDYCRVSIGTMDEMQAFADAFKQLS